MNSEIREVVLVGAGKLAWHLGIALADKGVRVLQVCNRTAESGMNLALRTGAEYIDDPSKVTNTADLYIIAVSDKAVTAVASRLPLDEQMVVHTSGSLGMEVLAGSSKNTGVFYPVQTFSLTAGVDFDPVPICLEANSMEGMALLKQLASKLSRQICLTAGTQRARLHLAAVFASNFSNFMYVIAEDILNDSNLSPELILPLIRQVNAAMGGSGFFLRQTGPAVRNDLEILALHREMLTGKAAYLDIYNLITQNIINYQSRNGEL